MRDWKTNHLTLTLNLNLMGGCSLNLIFLTAGPRGPPKGQLAPGPRGPTLNHLTLTLNLNFTGLCSLNLIFLTAGEHITFGASSVAQKAQGTCSKIN